jgi:starch synthase
MYAGGDMLLMPSRYEPCGLAQMIGMRYGCIPVARATGGLRDTDHRFCQSPETSTGFLFEESTPEALAAALRRALTAYNDRQGWQARQRLACARIFHGSVRHSPIPKFTSNCVRPHLKDLPEVNE